MARVRLRAARATTAARAQFRTALAENADISWLLDLERVAHAAAKAHAARMADRLSAEQQQHAATVQLLADAVQSGQDLRRLLCAAKAAAGVRLRACDGMAAVLEKHQALLVRAFASPLESMCLLVCNTEAG